MVLLAFLVGLAAGVGAVLWSQDPAPTPVRGHEHAVELVLFEARPLRALPSRAEPDLRRPLRVDGALLLSGGDAANVVSFGALDRSLDVRAPALPLRISPTRRFLLVDLEVRVRDCKAATEWTPTDRPFTVRWRDQWGQVHLDRAGDFGAPIAASLTSYIDAMCHEGAS